MHIITLFFKFSPVGLSSPRRYAWKTRCTYLFTYLPENPSPRASERLSSVPIDKHKFARRTGVDYLRIVRRFDGIWFTIIIYAVSFESNRFVFTRFVGRNADTNRNNYFNKRKTNKKQIEIYSRFVYDDECDRMKSIERHINVRFWTAPCCFCNFQKRQSIRRAPTSTTTMSRAAENCNPRGRS